MKVKQLIEALKILNPNDIVILSRDSEGNGFGKLEHISTDIYADGEIHIRTLTPELKRQGYTESDLYHGKNGKKCVTLWP